MSFASMSFQMSGELGVPYPLVQTYLQEALNTICDDYMWSFQMQESGWITPGMLFPVGSPLQSAGTITTTSYGTTIVGDATAASAWVAYVASGALPLVTQCQIRVPLYSLYNIIAFDGVNTFTIDRPWTEPFGSGQTYMTYQAYYPAPTADFKRFLEIRDTTNAAPLDYWTMSRSDLSIIDPQRANFNQPAYVVPYETDKRVGSATLGYMLYELWPNPLSVLPYTMSYLRKAATLVAPTDTVSPPLTEDLVKWKAKQDFFMYKESQKGDGVARGAGADWRFLSQEAEKKYLKRLKICLDSDRDLCEMYFRRFVRDAAIGYWGLPFATANSGLNVGRM